MSDAGSRIVVELTYHGDEILWRSTVGRVRGEVQVRDLTIPVDDDVGPELECVVTGSPPNPFAGDERPQARDHYSGAEQPERHRAACSERLVERAFRVGDHDGPPEGKLISPVSSPSSALRGDDTQSGARSLDLGNGLRDTAKVGAADVSARVPREVHDSRMPHEVTVGDDLAVGVIELEARKLLHASSLHIL